MQRRLLTVAVEADPGAEMRRLARARVEDQMRPLALAVCAATVSEEKGGPPSPALTSNRPALLVLYCGRVSWGLVRGPVVSVDGEGVAARDAGVSEVTFAGAVVEAVEVPLLVSVEERAAQLAVSQQQWG